MSGLNRTPKYSKKLPKNLKLQQNSKQTPTFFRPFSKCHGKNVVEEFAFGRSTRDTTVGSTCTRYLPLVRLNLIGFNFFNYPIHDSMNEGLNANQRKIK